jgi:hypothetical protein
VRGRRGRKRRKLLDDPKESRGYSHLKEEALDRTMWRARFGRGLGPVVRQTTWCHILNDRNMCCGRETMTHRMLHTLKTEMEYPRCKEM